MKKIIALLLAVLLCVTLVSCRKPDDGLYEDFESSFTEGGDQSVDTTITEFPTKK